MVHVYFNAEPRYKEIEAENAIKNEKLEGPVLAQMKKQTDLFRLR